MWTLAFEHHEDCIPTQGHEPTREAATAAVARVGDGLTEKRRVSSRPWLRMLLFKCATRVDIVR
jgi:hypothetical protein